MVKTILTCIFLFNCLLLCSQPATESSPPESESYVNSGLIRAYATISQGVFFRNKMMPLYVYDGLEYYLSPKVSIKGEGFALAGYQGDNYLLQHHHMLCAGAAYHLPYKNFDPYFSFQPGIALTQFNAPLMDETEGTATLRVNPVFNAGAGFNYYTGRFVHFMLGCNFIIGRHQDYSITFPLNEFRIAAGLGF